MYLFISLTCVLGFIFSCVQLTVLHICWIIKKLLTSRICIWFFSIVASSCCFMNVHYQLSILYILVRKSFSHFSVNIFPSVLMLLFLCWFLPVAVEVFICFAVLVEHYFVWICPLTLVSRCPRRDVFSAHWEYGPESVSLAALGVQLAQMQHFQSPGLLLSTSASSFFQRHVASATASVGWATILQLLSQARIKVSTDSYPPEV